MTGSLKKFKTRALARPDVRETYDELHAEFAFLGKVLLTQVQVAERVGTTQSVIARLAGEAPRMAKCIDKPREAPCPSFV